MAGEHDGFGHDAVERGVGGVLGPPPGRRVHVGHADALKFGDQVSEHVSTLKV